MAVNLKKPQSEYRGVAYNTRSNLWFATISHKGERYYLGGFPTDRKAAQIRDAFILKKNFDVPLQVLSKPKTE